MVTPSDPVTVLMTVYNGEPYLPQTIRSVLSQTFEEFEFLIIDNASKDRSVEVIESFSDNRIRLVKNEKNLGQTGSLNIGLKLAKGKYIARIDSDDLALPERLEKQYAHAMEQNQETFGCLGTQIRFIDQQGKHIFAPQLPEKKVEIRWKLLSTSPIAHSSAFMSRSAVLEVGGYSDTFNFVQDQLLWIQLLAHGKSVTNLGGRPLALIRRHQGSATHTAGDSWRNESIRATQVAAKLLFGLDFDEQTATRLNKYLDGLSLGSRTSEQEFIGLLSHFVELSQKKELGIEIPIGKSVARAALIGKEIGLARQLRLLFFSLRISWRRLLAWRNIRRNVRYLFNGYFFDRLRFVFFRRTI